MQNFKKHPDVAKASKSGEPNMEDEEVHSPVAFMKHIESSMKGETADASNNKVGVETIGSGNGAAPGPNQPIPGSGTANQSTGTNTPPTPPPQVNDVGQNSQTGATDQQNVNDKQDSSSKKKGKKGLRKLIPF
jgi:hypothetical protein